MKDKNKTKELQNKNNLKFILNFLPRKKPGLAPDAASAKSRIWNRLKYSSCGQGWQ
jgi:hypothetical protein